MQKDLQDQPLFSTHYTVQNNCQLFWHIIPSAPMETNLTPLLAMKSRALLTLAILWNLILPLSGFCKVSPEITSSNSISLRPLRKSSSIFSIWVPALRKCEFTHAVKVWKWQNINRKLEKLTIVEEKVKNWNLICSYSALQKNSFFGHLWSKMGSIQIKIKYLKRAAKILISWLQIDIN